MNALLNAAKYALDAIESPEFPAGNWDVYSQTMMRKAAQRLREAILQAELSELEDTHPTKGTGSSAA